MKLSNLTIAITTAALLIGCGGGGGGGGGPSTPTNPAPTATVTSDGGDSDISSSSPSEEVSEVITVEEPIVVEEIVVPVIEEIEPIPEIPVLEEVPEEIVVPIEEPVVEEEPVEEVNIPEVPVVEEPVVPVVEEPIIEEPVIEEEPVEEIVVPVEEEPVVEEPVVEEEPVVVPEPEEVVVEEPVVEEPVEETPIVEEPVVEEEPVIEEPVVPVVEEPIVEEEPVVPVVEEEPEEEVVIEEPVVEEEPVEEVVVPVAPVYPTIIDPATNVNATYTADFTLGTQTQVNLNDIDSDEYKLAKHLSQVGTSTAYEQGWTGAGVTIAVFDSGIDSTHNDLINQVIGVNELSTGGSNAHGTHVAAIIAGEKNDEGIHGVAYDAKLLDVKVVGSSSSTQDIVDGLAYSVAQGAKIANMSIGKYYWSSISNDAYSGGFRDALANDLSIIVSAGNKAGTCLDLSAGEECNVIAALPAYQANADFTNNTYDGAFVAVGAVDWDNNIASYSNMAGITKDWFIVAPGGDVYSDGGGVISAKTGSTNDTQELAGTSQAAPIVSGAFALMAQKFPYLKGTEIRDIYFSTATDLGEVGVDEVYGHGLINIDKAMQPIGTLEIAQVVDNGQKFNLDKSSITVSESFGGALQIASLDQTLTLDAYSRGYNVDLTANVTTEDAAEAFSMNEFQELKFNNGIVIGMNDVDDHFSVGMDFDSVKVMYTRKNDLFGAEGSGALSLKGKTDYVDVSLKEWNGFSANVLYGRGTADVGGMLTSMSTVQGFGYGAKYTSDDKFTIGFTMPMRVTSGTVSSKVPTTKTMSGDIKYQVASNDLTPGGQEIKMYMSKVFEISNNESLMIAGNYTRDEGNIKGDTESGLLVNYSIKF